jgi:hypothetical protein
MAEAAGAVPAPAVVAERAGELGVLVVEREWVGGWVGGWEGAWRDRWLLCEDTPSKPNSTDINRRPPTTKQANSGDTKGLVGPITTWREVQWTKIRMLVREYGLVPWYCTAISPEFCQTADW